MAAAEVNGAMRRLVAVATFLVAGALATSAPALLREPATQPATTQPADLRVAYSVPADQWPAAHWDDLVKPEDRHELAVAPEVPYPADNPKSKERSDLGWALFWDPRLSVSGGVACVSCHHPDLGWADGKQLSQGHGLRQGNRNAPTILGSGHHKVLMWDGRADSLESQALLPIADERELFATIPVIEERLNAIPEFREKFKQAFGVEQITVKEVTEALASFQRTVNPGRSRFDQFVRGKPHALTDAQIRGLHLFRTKARCINCHNGPMLSDGQFHNNGLTYYGRPFEDLGRYALTKEPSDVGKFRTPTLRNVSRTSPYMHNGLFELDGVINLYNSGMPNERPRRGKENDPLFPKKSPLLRELELSDDEQDDLIAFLGSLEEPRLRVRSPKIPGLSTTQPTTEE